MSVENPVGGDVLVVRQPAVVAVKGGLLVVKPPKGVEGEEVKINPLTLQAVVVVGRRVTLSSAALHLLLQQQVPVVLSARSSIGVLVSPFTVAMPEARWAQYRYLSSESLKARPRKGASSQQDTRLRQRDSTSCKAKRITRSRG